MKKRINLRLILIAGIAVIVTMVCMTGIYYKLFQGQVRKDLQINARLLSGTGLFDDPDNTNVSLSEYYEVGEDLRVTWIAKDGTVLFDNDLDISQLPNHKNRPEVKKALFQGEGESVRRSDTMQMDNYYYALRLENGTVIRVATQARSVYSVFLAASPFVMLILILIVSICIVLAHFLTKQLLHPIERLAENMEDTIEEPVYKELVPFVNTIRKQHENILMAAKVRQDFTANVSHELKTPLTSMKVLADSLVGQEGVPEELYQEFMGDITAEIDRENKIITDLLSLVKMDKKAADLNVEHLNINQLLEDILKRLRPIADKQKVELVLESFRPVSADVDEVKITLAFTNLIENAIKYNKEDGWVHVSLNADHQYFYLKVEDSGIGIPEDSLGHIYERFYRVDKSHSREIGGTGLGLAITRNAVLMHRGAIKVFSTEGEGTIFNVRIPLNYIS